MDLLAAILLMLVSALGMLLAAVGLPGIWLMALAAAGIELWRANLLSGWAIGAVIGLALAAEIAELIAGAVGAKRAGGSRRSALGALVGAIVGGILGTVLIPIPIVGTVLGSALGAGACAMALELTVRTDPDGLARPRALALRVGRGAVVGRLVATVLKACFAALAAGVLVASLILKSF